MTIKERLIKFLQNRKKIINISALEIEANCPKLALYHAINGKSELPNKHFGAIMDALIPIFYAKEFESIYNDYVEHNSKISANIVLTYTEDNDPRFSIYWLKVTKDFPPKFSEELKFNLSRFGYNFTIQCILYQSRLVCVRASNNFLPDQVEFMVSEVYDSLFASSIKST
jgi:hypothetical protein